MTDNPKLERLARASAKRVAEMSDDERAEMFRRQRDSWVKAEMSWPKPKFKWVDGVKVYETYEDYCA